MLELFTRTARTQSYFGSKIATETFSGVLCTAVTLVIFSDLYLDKQET